MNAAPERSGRASRLLAREALERIDQGAAYANLVLPPMLERSGLDDRDRRFVTELVYGVTRMRRRCDWLVDRFVMRPLDPPTRAALRIGAYQLVELEQPPHAAVATAVDVAPRRSRGLVNAVLRRVATADRDYPDLATELSYPDWVVARLERDLGTESARAALAHMNRRPELRVRPDGYVQDRASQWVVESLDARPDDLVIDLCAGPGGKATALGHLAGLVVACDRSSVRARLVADNAATTGTSAAVVPVVADGRGPPLRPRSGTIVLVDAPCSGLGVLRRRPDARWRITEAAIDRLQGIQIELVEAGRSLVRPGGLLAYAVCTLTDAETLDVAATVDDPDLVPVPLAEPWQPFGSGGRLLPHEHDTDGMTLFCWRRRG